MCTILMLSQKTGARSREGQISFQCFGESRAAKCYMDKKYREVVMGLGIWALDMSAGILSATKEVRILPK